MASLQASRAPEDTAPEDERAGAPQDQREASGARPLTVAEQRRQISRANRLARYEQIIALHRQGTQPACDCPAPARQSQGGPSLGACWNLSGARAHWQAPEQTHSLSSLPASALGARLSQRPSTGARDPSPEDFADQPRWSASSQVTGGHACLGHRSGYVARNDRQLRQSSVVSHPGTRPGCSSKTRRSSRQTSGHSSSASATRMLICRNSISWDKTLCRWSSSDKHTDWTPGLLRLTRVPRWNSEDLLLASSAITPPSKQRCLFLGARDRWRVRLRA